MLVFVENFPYWFLEKRHMGNYLLFSPFKCKHFYLTFILNWWSCWIENSRVGISFLRNFYCLASCMPDWEVRNHCDSSFCDLPTASLKKFARSSLSQEFWNFTDQIRSVAQSCPTLCDPMNRSTPGLPVHHQLPGFLLKLMSIESVMPSNHLILCRPLSENILTHCTENWVDTLPFGNLHPSILEIFLEWVCSFFFHFFSLLSLFRIPEHIF